MSELWQDAKEPVILDAFWNSLCLQLSFGKILYVAGYNTKLLKERETCCRGTESVAIWGQRQRYVVVVAWGRWNGPFPYFVTASTPPLFFINIRKKKKKNPSKNEMYCVLNLGDLKLKMWNTCQLWHPLFYQDFVSASGLSVLSVAHRMFTFAFWNCQIQWC